MKAQNTHAMLRIWSGASGYDMYGVENMDRHFGICTYAPPPCSYTMRDHSVMTK